MEIFILVLGIILSISGIIGCFVPAIPGPPLNYISIVLLYIMDSESFSFLFILITGIMVLSVTILDYILPIYGSKKFGVSKSGIWGSVAGMIIGILFFPPFGMITGLFIGALTGELVLGKSGSEAIKGGFITFFFSLIAILIKVSVSLFLTFYFVKYWF